jgi:hypothetical protein
MPRAGLRLTGVAALGALSQAWTSVAASLPLGWRLSGLYRFEDLWIGLAEGPEFDDYARGSVIIPLGW